MLYLNLATKLVIFRIIALLSSLLFLSSCNESLGGYCFIQNKSINNGIVIEDNWQIITLRADGSYSSNCNKDTKKLSICKRTYGQWKNTGIFVTGGQRILFNVDGKLILAPAYGIKDTSKVNNFNRNNYSSLDSHTQQEFSEESKIISHAQTGSLVDSDYQNNGKGIKHIIPADGIWRKIFTPRQGTKVYIDVDKCNENINSKWTWKNNWRTRHQHCWFNKIGIKIGCHWDYNNQGPWDNSCNADCDKGNGTCWHGDKNTCGISDSCWNMNGRGLVVSQNNNEESTGDFWHKIIPKSGDLKLKIKDPNGNKSKISESTINYYEQRKKVAKQKLGQLKNITKPSIDKLQDDIDKGIYGNKNDQTYKNAIFDLQTQKTKYYQNIKKYSQQLEEAQAILTTNVINYETIGGYTLYVKSTPWIVDGHSDPNSLRGCVVNNGDPNKGSKCTPFKIRNGETIQATQDGIIWLKIIDPDIYEDNFGSYDIKIFFEKKGGKFSDFIKKILNIIYNVMKNAGKNFFEKISCDTDNNKNDCNDYLSFIHYMLIIYIIAYGIMYLYGLVTISHGDLIIRILKIGLIIAITRKDSWQFFYDDFFRLIIKGGGELIAKATGNTDPHNPFAFLDTSVGIALLTPVNFLKLFSFLYSGILGFIYFIMIFYGIYIFAKSIFNAVKAYAMSFIFIGILMGIAPIFIPFALFNLTKKLTEKWFGLLVRYMIEPVIILVGLVILNGMLLTHLEALFAYSICFKCALPVQLAFPGLAWKSNTLFCIPGFLPWGFDNQGDGNLLTGYVSLGTVLSFLIIVKLMDAYSTQFASQITSFLTNTIGMTVSLTQSSGIKNLLARQQEKMYGDSKNIFSRMTGTDLESKRRRQRTRALEQHYIRELYYEERHRRENN